MKHDNYSSGLWHECDDQILGDDGLVIFRATENPLVKNQHRANVQRAVACVNAFDGIETGRLAGKGLGEFLAGEVRLNKAESQPDGSFGFTFSGFAVQIMAESFADQFRESGAVNYLELLFEHKEIGPLTVTMQRTQGLTPAQKLAKAEAERDELARKLSAKTISEQSIINAFGISGEGEHSKLVIEYVHGLVAENAAYKSAEIMEFLRLVECMTVDYNDSNHGNAREWIRHIAKASSDFEDKHGDTPWGRMKGLATIDTDAAIAELRAQGVGEFAADMWKRGNELVAEGAQKSLVVQVRLAAKLADTYVDNLRAGRKG